MSINVTTDWRFLPFIPTSGKVLVIYYDDYSLPLGLSANFELVVTLVDLKSPVKSAKLEVGVLSMCTISASSAQLPFRAHSFDLVAFPLGFRKTDSYQRDHESNILAATRQLLKPSGILYIGFPNRWSYTRFRKKSTTHENYISLSQAQTAINYAGFFIKEIYGTIPNHQVPERLFPLRKEALQFILYPYVHKKLGQFIPKRILPLIIRYSGSFLPGYSIVAQVEDG
jgi:SAM-dependent methyltransferase